MEPFSLLNPKVESQYSDSMKFDKQSSFGCLGTFLIGGGLFYLAMSLSGNAQDTVLKIAGVLFGIGMVYSLVQSMGHEGQARMTTDPRYFRPSSWSKALARLFNELHCGWRKPWHSTSGTGR
jgi:hypothetical protein